MNTADNDMNEHETWFTARGIRYPLHSPLHMYCVKVTNR